jgi:exosome complex component CSL4
MGSLVTGRVTRVTQRSADIEILCMGSVPLPTSFRGSLRKENVRVLEVDRVEMHKSFRPGDVVRAVVASMGSARSYELSTARNDLGVVDARSEAADAPMVAVSWQEMMCPVSKQVEFRKVAKTSGA